MRALTNALDNERLHHAYLFTGTRGVGKTTVARVFARCLNCEQGITSKPCGSCSSCAEIAEGRSVDLIEVDAASRTGVDDTLELLENVQYMPTHARFKVYLIDEVHMFSRSSFNALLKTLEEPPQHVKFLLVTTDPKKLPITVLSRCLQFNLKNMTRDRIVEHLRHVLGEEGIESEDGALHGLARAAEGSMRDALSLTDQAVAFGNGRLTEADVSNLLGTIDTASVFVLLQALVARDGSKLLEEIARLANYSVDFPALLDEILLVLHRLAVLQAVPESEDPGDTPDLKKLAAEITGEDLQLFYQIGLIGQRDLPLAPSLQSGFEMVMLRMLSFTPLLAAGAKKPAAAEKSPAPPGPGSQARARVDKKQPDAGSGGSAPGRPAGSGSGREGLLASVGLGGESDSKAAKAGQKSAPEAKQQKPAEPEAAGTRPETAAPKTAEVEARADKPAEDVRDNPGWIEAMPKLGLAGLTADMASRLALLSREGSVWEFALSPEFSSMVDEELQKEVAGALSRLAGCQAEIRIQLQKSDLETPAQRKQKNTENARQQALKSMQDDPGVGLLQKTFDASLDEASVVPRQTDLAGD